jgi:hypothetical protein
LEEVWKAVPNYEGFYEVSNLGRFRSLDGYRKCRAGKLAKKKGQIIKQGKYPNGYMQVHFKVNGIDKCFLSHRIVADVFVINDNPLEKTTVNHIDGDKTNNNAQNLEWLSMTDNHKHAFRIGLKNWKDGMGEVSIPVVQLDKENLTLINTFKSISEAKRSVGAKSCSGIRNCCAGTAKSANGYKWMRQKDYLKILESEE